MITIAAILARGLGSRMRQEDATARVDDGQATAAATGVKGMIPIKRPFVEYVVSALADAGIGEIVFIVAPGESPIRTHFERVAPPTRTRVRFAIQEEPIGTANAVVAAAEAIGDMPFLVLNADNYYPIDAYRALAADDSAGTIAFERDALVTLGNIDAQRVRSFAVLDVTVDDMLAGIIEKPGDTLDLDAPSARWVGMNVWAVTPEIVDACRRVPKSARGEFELPEAVGLAIGEGVRVRAIRMSAAVLDLSRRSDIAAVAERLAMIDPIP